MPSLKKATFPKDAAFSSNNYLLDECKALEELTAPADIYNKCYISSEAFKTLKITAGETVKSISGSKKNLETLVLADTVKTIGRFDYGFFAGVSHKNLSAVVRIVNHIVFGDKLAGYRRFACDVFAEVIVGHGNLNVAFVDDKGGQG